jgi:hypothetical protein
MVLAFYGEKIRGVVGRCKTGYLASDVRFFNTLFASGAMSLGHGYNMVLKLPP